MRFYLGTHKAIWLQRTDVPLFISHRTLRTRKSDLKPLGRWALDSGGYTELDRHGRWTITQTEYVEAVHRYASWGGLDWASPQDWMTEDNILAATGRSKGYHLERTVESYAALKQAAPTLPWVPVIQGQDIEDYLWCVELYRRAGIDLRACPVVGVGSVCRREAEDDILHVFRELAPLGLSMHGYGVKTKGLAKYGPLLTSADSMAWSWNARWEKPLPGCRHGEGGDSPCNNCMKYALAYRSRVLARLDYAT